jgi:protein TonB
VSENVERILAERAALDRGFPNGLVVSGLAHSVLIVMAIVVPMLMPRPPLINVVMGTFIPLPPGGGGSPSIQPPAPAPQAPKPEPKPPQEEPPKPEPKIIKPPKEEPKKGLPALDSRTAKKTKSTPAPPRASGAAGGTGINPQTPGVQFGTIGPGVPGGTDPSGDWYLAGVQRRIWTLWMQQIHSDTQQSVTVRFTILADGNVEGVEVVQSSGIYILDTAAQRAIMTAAPFSPLPKNYETNRITIDAIFKAAR